MTTNSDDTFCKENVANNVAQGKVQDNVKKSHNMTENDVKSEKTTQDVQKNCLSLTEQWKNGELKKDKKYYTKDKLGRTYIKTYNKKGFKGLVEEVLCEVPSYLQWNAMLESNDSLVQTINALKNRLVEVTEENAKLKELLKECQGVLLTYSNMHGNYELYDKIDEVLK